jgi:adenosylcobinamide kinase/adenosylcobinamide-phosphate guanylyltransferase
MPQMTENLTLILGGARSGKSVFAEAQISACAGTLIYLATGRAWDDEMTSRIENHKQRRGAHWHTVEAPIELADALDQVPDQPVLIDCLTLWITNLMMEAERAEEFDYEERFEGLVASLKRRSSPTFIVSNEVGLGIVPENKMAREFRDLAGQLHQMVAAVAGEVFFVTAGLPRKLK